jgi:hypothetical protein
MNTSDHYRALWVHLEPPGRDAKKPGSTNGKTGSISNHCRGVSETQHLFGNASSAPGNHSYYLAFNNFENSYIQCIFSFIYLYNYPSAYDISALAEGSALEQFEVQWMMNIERTL